MAKSPYPEVFDAYTRPQHPGLDCSIYPDKCKQEFAEEADINRIMSRYTETGMVPEAITGTYGDFSESVDFHQAQNILARADAQFSSLPADVRARFENDPAKFLDFVHDEKNLEELQELGLLSQEGNAKVEAARARRAAGPSGGGDPSGVVVPPGGK